MYVMIVRRGDFQRQEMLHRTFGQFTPVVWDRRKGERRDPETVHDGDDRRHAERRGPPPASWAALGFVVVNRTESA